MQTGAKLGRHRYPLRFLFLIFFCTFCQAVSVNRTIDDSFGDSVTGFKPIYNPSRGLWVDQTCSTSCDIQPNASFAYDGTWAAATYTPPMKNVSITLQFTGVAIWVFFILANANHNGPDVTTKTYCNFTLDGSPAGSFGHDPDMSTFDLVYNTTVFSKTGLTNSSHQLIIMTNDWPFDAYLNFDYAIYTALTDSSNSTSSPSNPSQNNKGNSSTSNSVAPIVGGVVGGVAVITIASLLFLFFRIRTSKKSSVSIVPARPRNPTSSEHIVPFRNTPAGTATIPPLLIREKGHTNLSSNNRDELRVIRQTQIDQRLHSARREMEDLTARQPNADESQGEAGQGQENQDLREQVRFLTAQIELLQRERQSDWALGLSDGPPPAYVR